MNRLKTVAGPPFSCRATLTLIFRDMTAKSEFAFQWVDIVASVCPRSLCVETLMQTATKESKSCFFCNSYALFAWPLWNVHIWFLLIRLFILQLSALSILQHAFYFIMLFNSPALQGISIKPVQKKENPDKTACINFFTISTIQPSVF